MSNDIFLIGGGMHARVVIDTLFDCALTPVVMVDPSDALGSYRGIDVIPPDDFAPAGKNIVVAIGDPRVRAEVADDYLSRGAVLADPVVHPSVYRSPTARLGQGTIVLAHSVLDASVQLGKNVLVNLNSVVGHDVVVHDHVHVSSRVVLGGAASIGEGSTVGLGATVCPKVSVGSWVTVGAGAVVLRDVPDGIRVVGIPAKEG